MAPPIGESEIASTTNSPAQRIPELDGLRGIAILLVLLRHYIHHPSLLLLGPQWGWMGVNLFFVLSGFLITSILLRLAAHPGALKVFYARRTLRIFPLYFLALLVYFVAPAVVGTPQPGKTVFLYVTFLQAFIPPFFTHLIVVPHPGWVVMGFAVLWSLSVEEYFYILWAPVVAFTRANRRVLFILLGLILFCTPWIRFFYPDPKGGQELFIAQMDSLAAGCLAAILWQDHGSIWKPALQRHARWLYGCVAALIAVAIWIDFATGITKRSVFDQRIFNATDYTVLWIAWSLWLLVTLAVAGTQAWMPRLLRNPLLCWLGRISFCLYVVHYPVYLALRNYGPHSVALIVALAISLAVSWLSWKYFEGPIARWKQKQFRYRMQAEPEAPLMEA
jgi:peptidoglycan/LPS O-acetylase OafA/YrhL